MKNQISKRALICLQLLRWLVGWHFLYEGLWKLMQTDGWSCLSYLDSAQGPLAWLFKWMSSQAWLIAIGDQAVMWGLVLIGVSLVTGVLSRLAAVFGIMLMAMFYSAQPPEPFASAISGADGRFFLFERNVIESLALAAIVVIPTWRGWRKTLLPGLVVLAVFGGCFFRQKSLGAFKSVEAVTSATVKVHEFSALAALREKLADTVDLAGVRVSRLALGGDILVGRAHARDLIWADEFMYRYNLGGTLERTIRFAVRTGINALFAEKRFLAMVREQAAVAGGEMHYFVECSAAEDVDAAKAAAAAGAYTSPVLTDSLVKKGDADALRALFDAMKRSGLRTGIGSEDLATVKFCAENGLVPDFWVLAFHSHDYAGARMEVRCNNLWCEDPQAVAEYMKSRKEPWVAVRGLAGGAIEPKDALSYAYANGVDVAALDLLDFRVVDAVNDAVSMLKKEGGK